MNHLRLNVDESSWITRPRDPKDEWSGEDTQSEWTVRGLSLVEESGYRSVPNYLKAKIGESVWALYAVYSTGDSFSHQSDGCFEFINVFATQEDAAAAAKELKNATGQASYPLSYGGSCGFGYVPWSGYFESLSYIEAKEFVVGQDRGANRWYRD